MLWICHKGYCVKAYLLNGPPLTVFNAYTINRKVLSELCQAQSTVFWAVLSLLEEPGCTLWQGFPLLEDLEYFLPKLPVPFYKKRQKRRLVGSQEK